METNFSTFKNFIDRYNNLINKVENLEQELDESESYTVKEVMEKAIDKLNNKIKDFEDMKLYTESYIDNLKN